MLWLGCRPELTWFVDIPTFIMGLAPHRGMMRTGQKKLYEFTHGYAWSESTHSFLPWMSPGLNPR
jgi:hypothetical protein